jgi:signal transduction histidine kinase
LSIVKSIVLAHGGQVGVDQRRGGGASFWFTVPTAGRSMTPKAHLSLVL